MKDVDDWDYILNTVDALFYRLSKGIVTRTGLSLVDAHEEAWELFEQGHFRMVGTDDGRASVVPCHNDNERRTAVEQNKPLADYRRRVIKEAVASAACSPTSRFCSAAS
jgi:hypothetical protein